MRRTCSIVVSLGLAFGWLVAPSMTPAAVAGSPSTNEPVSTARPLGDDTSGVSKSGAKHAGRQVAAQTHSEGARTTVLHSTAAVQEGLVPELSSRPSPDMDQALSYGAHIVGQPLGSRATEAKINAPHANGLVFSPNNPVAAEYFEMSGSFPTKIARIFKIQWLDGRVWVTLGSRRTSSRGAFTVEMVNAKHPSREASIRVVAVRAKIHGRTYPQAVLRASLISATQRISLELPRNAYVDKAVTATVAISPARKGRKVSLQRKIGSSWSSLASAKTDSRGRALIKFASKNQGGYSYRVLASSWRGASSIASSGASVRFITTKPLIRISDANLLSCADSALGLPKGTQVTVDQAARVTTFKCNNTKISTLKGIEHFESVSTLSLAGDGVSSIDYLGSLANIKSLDLSRNQIASVDPVTWALKLTQLNLRGNKVANLLPLSSLINLTTLDLGSNKIADISSLAKLSNLKDVQLDHNRVASLSPILKLRSLRQLNLASNGLSDLAELGSKEEGDDPLPNLSDVNLSSNKISEVSPLSSLNLSSLDVSNNSISSIDQLWNGVTLRNLNVSYNHVSDISGLSWYEKLVVLNVSHNDISDISSLRESPQLSQLDVSNNRIASLSALENQTRLTILKASNNDVSDVTDLSHLSLVKELDLSGNRLTTINSLGFLTSLTSLNLGDNEIKNITALRYLISLHELDLHENQISDVTPISKLVARGLIPNLLGNPVCISLPKTIGC